MHILLSLLNVSHHSFVSAIPVHFQFVAQQTNSVWWLKKLLTQGMRTGWPLNDSAPFSVNRFDAFTQSSQLVSLYCITLSSVVDLSNMSFVNAALQLTLSMCFTLTQNKLNSDSIYLLSCGDTSEIPFCGEMHCLCLLINASNLSTKTIFPYPMVTYFPPKVKHTLKAPL
jgi:hypothetical protein